MKEKTKLEFVPLSPAIGIEVRGLDVAKPIDNETASILRRTWAENSILLLRDQDLTEEQQFGYARIYGEVAARVKPPIEKRSYRADPENPMQIVTNAIDNNGNPVGSLGDGEMWFHTDKCYVKKPHRASFLYALEIPSEGGHTKFASLYNGYESLPEELKKKMEGRKVLQMYDYTKTKPGDLNQPLEELLHYWQPVFVTNPDTARRAVYISRLMSRRIEGYSDEESQSIIDAVSDIVEASDNICDILSCLHARTDWPRDQRRTLRRVTIKGEGLR